MATDRSQDPYLRQFLTPDPTCYKCQGTNTKCSSCTARGACHDGEHDACNGWVSSYRDSLSGRKRNAWFLCTCDCHYNEELVITDEHVEVAIEALQQLIREEHAAHQH